MRSWLDEVRYSNDYDRMLEEDDCYYNKPISRYDMRFPSDPQVTQTQLGIKKTKRNNKYILEVGMN